MSYPNADISFPGLFGDWRFTLSPKLLDIGNGIYWYGVLIAAGLLIALWFFIFFAIVLTVVIPDSGRNPC